MKEEKIMEQMFRRTAQQALEQLDTTKEDAQ